MKSTVLLVLVSLIFGTSCTDKQELEILDGTYAGSYHIYNYSTGRVEKTDGVSVVFEGKSYSSSPTPSPNRTPAGGSGTYEIIQSKMIDFSDKNFWTADFDWNLILTGKFNYQIKGDSLIMTRYFEGCPSCLHVGTYQYRLKRLKN